MALFLPTLTLLLIAAPNPEVYGCVCYLGQEPDQAGKRYGWSLAEQRPCECTEFRLGGVNIEPQIKPCKVTIGEDLRMSINKGQIVLSPDCKEEQHAWIDPLSQAAGSLKHVSIGGAGVWGVDVHNHIYYKCRHGCSWKTIPGELKQVDVGNNVVWGVSQTDTIYYREVCDSTSWISVSGHLKHVSVSQKGHVWGVNLNDGIFHRRNTSGNQIAGSTWIRIGGRLKQISIGSGGVWGVNRLNEIYHRVGTHGDPDSDPDGSSWRRVRPHDITLKYVSSGDVIYVVDTNDAIYYRLGTTVETPTGTVWQKIAGSLKQIESISSTFWGVDAENKVYTNDTLS